MPSIRWQVIRVDAYELPLYSQHLVVDVASNGAPKFMEVWSSAQPGGLSQMRKQPPEGGTPNFFNM